MRKHKKIAREALWDTADAHTTLGALQTQMENAVIHRNAAQAETQAAHAQRVHAIQLGMKMDWIRMDITDITFVFIFLFGFGFEYR